MTLDWLWNHLLFDEWAGRVSALAAQATPLLASAIDPSKRLSLLPLLSAVLIAALVFVRLRRSGASETGRGLRRYLFPRSIVLNKSSRIDLQIAVFNGLTKPASIVLMGLTVVGFAVLIEEGLDRLFGEATLEMSGSAGAVLLLGLIVFLVTDLATYITHRISHEWPLLWAFHRVHHSAPVLNPLTQQRRHPLSSVLSRLIDLMMVSPMLGLVLYFWDEQTGPTVALIVRWCFGLFALVGGNLRHSHVWLSFGRLETILVSPAQHQIHHSRAERHWDCNYGEVLAIWDWMFGTLYIAKAREPLRFGLSERRFAPHRSLWQAMIEPFQYAYRLRRPAPAPANDQLLPPPTAVSAR